jgi:hypothetical protein
VSDAAGQAHIASGYVLAANAGVLKANPRRTTFLKERSMSRAFSEAEDDFFRALKQRDSTKGARVQAQLVAGQERAVKAGLCPPVGEAFTARYSVVVNHD